MEAAAVVAVAVPVDYVEQVSRNHPGKNSISFRCFQSESVSPAGRDREA